MRNVAIAGALLLLAGCGSSGGSEDPPATNEETSETPSETTTASPSETPSETPSVAPATGPTLEVQGISVRVPKGYKVGYETPVIATARGKLGIVALVALAGPERSVDRMMKADLRETSRTEPLTSVERLPDTTMDGLPAFHYRGRPSPYYLRDVYGTWDGGYDVSIRFDLHDTHSAKERRELAESVVASYDSIG